jgi:serine/threonine-protein kinase
MAEVRDGWDVRLGRPVAVKMLYPTFAGDAVSRRRFEDEARAAAALSHPHIVAVHDSGNHDGTLYIVMERLSGSTLCETIARGPLPQDDVRSILDDILDALTTAHGAGILHRDIKPANILFSDAGDVKLADFGIAKTDLTSHTMTGQIVGTLAYLSAERLAGMPATISDDLYAVGVVGYEALTGIRPLPQCAPLLAVRPDISSGLAAVIEGAMARDPRRRFHDAVAMRAALGGGPVTPQGRPATKVMAAPLPEPATVMVRPTIPRGRTRTLLGVAAAVAAAVIAVAAVIADSTSRGTVPQPAGSSETSVPAPVAPSLLPPPPPPTAPVQLEQPPPRKGHGDNGNGNNHKPKRKGGDGD